MIKKVSIKNANKAILAGLQIEPKLKVNIDTSSISPDEVERLDIKFREELGDKYIAGRNSSGILDDSGVVEPRLEFSCLVDEKLPSKNQEVINNILVNFDELYGNRILEEKRLNITKVVDFKFNASFEDENIVAAGVVLFGDKFRKTKNGDYVATEWYNIIHLNPKNAAYGDRNEIQKYFDIKSRHTKVKTEDGVISEGTVNIFGNFNFLLYKVEKIGEKRNYVSVNDMNTPKEMQMMYFTASTGFMLLENQAGVLKNIVFKANETKTAQALDMNALANWLMKSWVEKKFTKGTNFLFHDEMEKISNILKREKIITATDIDNLVAEKNNRFNRKGGRKNNVSAENMSYNPFKDIDVVQTEQPAEKKSKKAKAQKAAPPAPAPEEIAATEDEGPSDAAPTEEPIEEEVV